VAITALRDSETALAALACVEELGGSEQAVAVTELARRHPSTEMLAAAGKVLSDWASRAGRTEDQRKKIEQAFAEIHGGTGVLMGWHVLGPMSSDCADLIAKLRSGQSFPMGAQPAPDWHFVLSKGSDARVQLAPKEKADSTWLAYCEVAVHETTTIE